MATNGHTNGYTNGHTNGSNGYTNGHATNGHTNGASKPNGAPSSTYVPSRLPAADPDAVQDLICVGFGPASLAVAIALHDALEANPSMTPPKVLFLEKQEHFAWHAGMLLPGAKMQISFVKDLATLRDPRSEFTFINYLHRNNRLVEFTNLSTFLPARVEYEDYLRWCANHFSESVVYNSEVSSVSPVEGQSTGDGLSTFQVVAQSPSGQKVYKGRNVLMAVGGKPSIPACLPASSPRVIHSSQFAQMVPKILSDKSAPVRVAVIGAGQSAAEIFNNIQVLYPNSKTSLVMRSEFLKPSDDSPFVNSIFNPEYIDEVFPRPAKSRQHLLADARATNYGVVRLELIEALYERLYHQRRLLGTDETKWPHRIRGNRRIVRVDPGEGKSLRMFIEEDSDSASSESPEELEVDLIIAATGYKRNAHVTMMEGLWPLLPPKTPSASADEVTTGVWEVPSADPKVLSVSRDYRVQFAPGSIAAGSGVWLQGCCEGSHGLSDTLLSVLATRSGEIVESIFGGSQ